MAKFTSTRGLDLAYHGHRIKGPAGTVFRIPDSLQGSFAEEFGDLIPGIVWVVQDEMTTAGGSHPDFAAHVDIGLSASSAIPAHAHEGVYEPTHAHPYAATVHAHAISATTDLQTTLDAKAASAHAHDYAATSHAHLDEITTAIDTHAATPHGGSLPAGLIVMWGGAVSAIPSGWLLCDGANGTPDLRSRFVKGAAAGSDPGATGGAQTHVHADHTDVINHTHPVTDPGHTHVENQNSATTGGLTGWGARDTSTNTSSATGYSTASATTGVTTNNPAGGVAALTHDAVNHEPAYYALCFIQKS